MSKNLKATLESIGFTISSMLLQLMHACGLYSIRIFFIFVAASSLLAVWLEDIICTSVIQL
jgi:hypothetical protein